MPESANNSCPIDEATQKWMQNAFLWMLKEFGTDVLKKKALVPDLKDFPIRFNGKFEDAKNVLQILSRQMDLDNSSIALHIYREGIREVNANGGQRIFMQTAEGQRTSAGLYYGKDENGLYQIGLAEDSLMEPEGMIGTFAHELAHVKLLGEKRLSENNEPLTDLLTVFFGVGVFNANKAFIHKNTFDSKRIGRSGYLTEMEWGYALALYTFLKGDENPEWADFLNRNVKKDFEDSLKYILACRPDIIGDATGSFEVGILPRFEKKQENPETEKIKKRHAPLADSPHYEDYCKARALYDQEEFSKAAELFCKILENGGNYWTCFFYGFFALINVKAFKTCTHLFEKYKDSFNNTIEIYINAGYAYSQTGDNHNARLNYEKALEMDAFNVHALNNLGFLLNTVGDFEEALENFNLALETDSTYAYAYNNRGYAKIKMGDIAGGYKDIMLGLELKQDNAYAYFNLGIYYLARNERDLAFQNFMRAKSLDPDIPEMEQMLARLQGTK